MPMTLSALVQSVREIDMDPVERRIITSCLLGVDIVEVFSPEGINPVSAKYGLILGSSLDLLTGWDLSREDHRQMVWDLIREKQPGKHVGSPSRT